MFSSVLPAASPARLRAATRLQHIQRNAARARLRNPRNAGLYTGPLTITDTGATIPTQVSASSGAYLINGGTSTPPISKGVWTIVGGTPVYAASGNFRVYAAIQATTGGNVGLGNGTQATSWRASVMAAARYVALKVMPTTAVFRILIDDQYVSIWGIAPTTTTGTTAQYLLLDFGSRAIRKVTVEGQQNCGFGGALVEATGKMWPINTSDALRVSMIGDSYVYGSSATVLGDGVAPVLGDWLGADMHASGVGGTGWAATAGGTAYTFGQRIANGDLALGGVAPEIIFLMASVNDRTQDQAVVQAGALAGIRAARGQYPDAPIIFFGCLGASYVTTTLATEASVQAAVTQAADPLCAFVPVSTEPLGAWMTGTGKIGTPANDGNSDWGTIADGTHPGDEGAAYIGRRYASAALTALGRIYSYL